ncbi:carboxyl-terminal-processing peptidase 1, chloroplastic [Dorcoceras hygrometricum]|uniref:Carboxyl-terminal-processing peptidase 1, chloroplastic n=1 Tax=Dorcoceras hygrometricum TaxID=472368 RepID=A0A2Z7BDE7_9LAMI|nr:carboxyl-terminal-processing peptidase 1, chloroplastic [Dorcoceras hygrometricum]
MAQYQILARKTLGPFGTGPKTIGVENSVATPPWDRGRWPHGGAPPPAQRAAHCRTLRAQVGGRRRAPPCATIMHGIQLDVGPQPLRLRNHNFGLAHRIMVKCLATSPHDPLGITDSAYKNQLVVVSVQYGPFNTYIPIRSTTIGKSRVARDPIAMHTSWRSNSDIPSVTSIGYPRMKARGESSTMKHRLPHTSGPHPIPPPSDPK